MLISTQKRLKPYGSMLQDIIVEVSLGNFRDFEIENSDLLFTG